MKIDIIGTGNVGTHLYNALRDKAEVYSIPARTLDGLHRDADMYLISVSDAAIVEVADRVSKMAGQDSIIAHTSGSTPISAISGLHGRSGVFYPLQTFSKDVSLEYSEIPFFIEGTDPQVCESLRIAARLISQHVYDADSACRRELHIASVLACNFVNHLWALADGYLTEKGLKFDMLRPLVKETCRKIQAVSPYSAQTGPAVRHDIPTIISHLHTLDINDTELHDIYDMLTRSIIKHHPKK